MHRPWFADVVIGIGLFLLSVVLNLPLFMPGESPYRDSIGLGYAGMARFISENPSMWGWNPLQYCGLPTQFMYVPVLHYGTAILAWITRSDPVYLYRLLAATCSCLGPTTLFLFIRYFTRSRGWALAASVAYMFFSPLYGLIPQVDRDRGLTYLPWRLHVLAKYGEGPHNTGLMLLPLAWIATWAAVTSPRYWRMFVCAVLFAVITLTNWIAALALAFSSLMLLIAAFKSPDALEFRFARAFGAAALAYLLACFWLTPTFIQTIAFNWPADAYNYHLQAAQWRLIGGFVVAILSIRLAVWWLRWKFYETFVALCAFGFGYTVLIYYAYGIDMIPESRRYALEFEFFIVAALFAFLRFCWVRRNEIRLICGAGVVAASLFAGLPQMWIYVTQGWQKWQPIPSTSTMEYRVAQQLASFRPQGRVLVTGGLRFRLNATTNLQQVGGSFESGLRNRTPVDFSYHIRIGGETAPGLEAALSLLEMKALGVEYVVVHGPKSDEYYRDYRNPLKFEGVLERVAAIGDGAQDDLIYRVPFRSLAHLIHPSEQPATAFRDKLAPYVRALEDSTRPQLQMRWIGSRDFEIEGPVPEGMLLSAQVTYDDGWQAVQDGRTVEITRSPLGFMDVHARPTATSKIHLRYSGTMEQRLMAVISLLSWTLAFTVLRRTLRDAVGIG